MGFWICMFICNSIIPILMLVFGRIMWKHTPKEINDIYGYRTSRSMKNMDTWKFAHECSGKLWWKWGWMMLMVSVLVQLPFMKESDNVVGILSLVICTIQCVVLVLSIVPVENALKKTFDENGNRR